jgi:hypothetical protein
MPFDQVTGALLSLFVGTLLGREITRWLDRPRVYIRYENVAPLNTNDGIHWTIRVVNLGRTAATDCKGIISLHSIEAGDLVDLNEAYPDELLPLYRDEKVDMSFPRQQILSRSCFRQISRECLPWAASGNPSHITINPGVTELLDVFKVQLPEKGGYIILPSESGWRQLRARIRKRDILGEIMICPANDFPSIIIFELRFLEDGHSSFRVRQLPWRRQILARLRRDKYYYG